MVYNLFKINQLFSETRESKKLGAMLTLINHQLINQSITGESSHPG